jgi:hypothetical protein
MILSRISVIFALLVLMGGGVAVAQNAPPQGQPAPPATSQVKCHKANGCPKKQQRHAEKQAQKQAKQAQKAAMPQPAPSGRGLA